MAIQNYFTFTATSANYYQKKFKFKVSDVTKCTRLLNTFKARGNTVTNLRFVMELNGKVYRQVRFNRQFYELTGFLMPQLRDFR